MRKIVCIILIAIFLFFYTSCVPNNPDTPPGVWRSKEPPIVLYLDPDYQHPQGRREYLGLYTINGEDVKIFVVFGNGMRFHIYNHIALSENAIRGGYPYSLLTGNFRVINNQIRYRPFPLSQERMGTKNMIIFNRIEDYDLIDPLEWFPNWNPEPDSD